MSFKKQKLNTEFDMIVAGPCNMKCYTGTILGQKLWPYDQRTVMHFNHD